MFRLKCWKKHQVRIEIQISPYQQRNELKISRERKLKCTKNIRNNKELASNKVSQIALKHSQNVPSGFRGQFFSQTNGTHLLNKWIHILDSTLILAQSSKHFFFWFNVTVRVLISCRHHHHHHIYPNKRASNAVIMWSDLW